MIANIFLMVFVIISAVLLSELTPEQLLVFVVFIVFAFVLGYAFRGSIRREISLLPTEAAAIAARLEKAARIDATALENEAAKIIRELRANV